MQRGKLCALRGQVAARWNLYNWEELPAACAASCLTFFSSRDADATATGIE
jgi:hypothetical protein